jgi:hypothetical protein
MRSARSPRSFLPYDRLQWPSSHESEEGGCGTATRNDRGSAMPLPFLSRLLLKALKILNALKISVPVWGRPFVKYL